MSSIPFPTELIILILEPLDVPSLLRCMQVCKQFQSIIQESSALLYKVSLFSAQMFDVKHCDWDLPSRLEAIRRHTDAWNNLQFPICKRIPMEDGRVTRDGLAWDLVNGILAQARPNGGISCVQMPCYIKGIPERRWDVLPEFSIAEFAIDASQDLLAAVEFVEDENQILVIRCDVHLRSFSTGMVHPMATCPRITQTFFEEQSETYVLISVCGPYVGIFFGDNWAWRHTSNFVIWDWRNGDQIMLLENPEYTSFTFLSEELVLVAFIDNDKQVSLRVFEVPPGNSVSSARDVEYLCKLRYPRLRSSLHDVLISSAPLTTSAVPSIPSVPFAHSPTADVLITVIFEYEVDSRTDTVVHLVPRSTILNQVSSISTSSRKFRNWKSWGPEGSRMLKLTSSNVWTCLSYGMKFIYCAVGGKYARVFDFNPYATTKDANSSASCALLPWEPLPMETKIRSRRKPFKIDMVTSLPGREAYALLPRMSVLGWEGAMITEDHIVLILAGRELFAYVAM